MLHQDPMEQAGERLLDPRLCHEGKTNDASFSGDAGWSDTEIDAVRYRRRLTPRHLRDAWITEDRARRNSARGEATYLSLTRHERPVEPSRDRLSTGNTRETVADRGTNDNTRLSCTCVGVSLLFFPLLFFLFTRLDFTCRLYIYILEKFRVRISS